jgi:hypothetical protein
MGGPNSKVVKIDISTFTEVASLTLSNMNYASSGVVVGNYLYVMGQNATTSVGAIAKIDLSTFTEVTQIDVSQYVSGRCCYSGNFLYCGSDVGAIKVNLTTFTEVASVTFPDPDNLPNCFNVRNVVTDNNFLYIVLYSDPAIIKKFTLTTFAEVNSLTLNVGEGSPNEFGACLPKYSNRLYVTCDVGKIVRVNLQTFARIDMLDISGGDPFFTAYGCQADGTYLFVGENSAPIVMHRIRLSDFTELDTLALNAGENYARDMIFT